MIRTKDTLIQTLQGGAHVRETRIHEPVDKSVWVIAETGETVSLTALKAVKGSLSPLTDGLFGEAQTYAWAG